MKATRFSAYGGALDIVEVSEPVCPTDGAIVAVSATGVCRSDWHAWQGHEPVALPHVPGHELSGRVAEVGADVRRWSVGDRVTVPFVCGCGRCEFCIAGEAQVCPDQTQPGFTGPGSFAERVAVHQADTSLVALPDAIDDVTAASLGCRFATAYRSLVVHGRLGTADVLAVHGCGGLGLSAVLIGAALGATVVAIDPRPSARQAALDLGALTALDIADDVPARVQALGGAHVSIDAIGRADVASASIRCLRRRGRHVQVGLLFGEHASPALPMDRVIAHELEIYGCHGMPASEYPAMLAAIADGTIDPRVLIGSVISFNEAGAALAAMGDPGADLGTGMTVVQMEPR